MSELVSVIITTYKREPEILKRAIDSVLSQSYKPLEVFVVDDNVDVSYLQMNELLLKNIYANSGVIYVKNEGTHGACAARNLGAVKSMGQILAFLDDDDAWEPNKLEVMVPLLKGDIGLVHCEAKFFRNGNLINSGLDQRITDDELHDMLMSNYIGGCSIPIISRKVFFDVGMFDESLPSSQDVDLWLRIIKSAKISYTDEKLVDYYITDNSITRDLERQTCGRRIILEKYSEDYEKYIDARDSKYNTIFITTILQGKVFDAIKEYNTYYSGRFKSKILNSRIFLKAIAKMILNRIRGYN